jgi:5,5'-dehydrodivanillate O-demethylase
MMKKKQQELLTRVGPGTPMGELLRRYWYPIAASAELKTGMTRPVRLLGENLILFRTVTGKPGLLDEHCPHRGTSLRCAAVDEEGIICPYHGWKFNLQGDCLSMPTEPYNLRLLQKAKTISYLVEELGGLIFAYLGPTPAPLLPRYDLFVWDNVVRDIGYALIPCNWLQIMENSVDPMHIEWLHGHHLGAVRAESGKSIPTHYNRRHVEIGFDIFRYGIIKRRILEGGSINADDWKIGHPLIFPVTLRVGTQRQHRFQIRVPVDDTHTLHFWYSCYLTTDNQAIPLQTDIPWYEVPWKDANGNFIVDYVDGGDIMTWVTQGPIADRSRELLVSSDKGIALYRKLLSDNLQLLKENKDPMGVIRDEVENTCIAFEQEKNKFMAGEDFLRETIEMSHVRYSPIKDQIIKILLGA